MATTEDEAEASSDPRWSGSVADDERDEDDDDDDDDDGGGGNGDDGGGGGGGGSGDSGRDYNDGDGSGTRDYDGRQRDRSNNDVTDDVTDDEDDDNDDEVEETAAVAGAAAVTTTADALAVRSAANDYSGPKTVPLDSAASGEIVALSNRIRRAMECPVCLLLAWNMSCLCPNGHAVCGACLEQLWNRDTGCSCPLCRAPMEITPDAQVTAVKLAQVVANAMVSCTHRSYGCPKLLTLYDVAHHEDQCPHAPHVRCMVSVCQWIGVYDQLFEHVRCTHYDVAIETTKNHLIVNDLSVITRNRRRTYLVRSPNGLFWTVLIRLTRGRIRTGVFIVEKRSAAARAQQPHRCRAPPTVAYRITLLDAEGQVKSRSRPRWLGWSSALQQAAGNRGDGFGATDTYTMVRSKCGRLEFHWWLDRTSDRWTIPYRVPSTSATAAQRGHRTEDNDSDSGAQ